ncbi:hypothetical protein [Spirillospora sp. NPDC029432]|uniref:hypothetical protein n=1 Tax=Spirillospora sp. NPDC029432 TaxID=3154599 RepID=UPI003451E065
MPLPSSRSSNGAVLGALAIGGLVATLVNAVSGVVISLLVNEMDLIAPGTIRPVNAVVALIVGACVGAPLLMTRPSGPIGAILAPVVAFAATIVGDLFGVIVYALFKSPGSIGLSIEIYFRSFAHLDAFGVIILLLAPATAGGIAVLRLLTAGKKQQPGGFQPAFGQPGQPPAGQFGQPMQPGQPAPYGAAPGQPGQFAPPGQPGQPAPYGQYAPPADHAQPPAASADQPGQYAPPADQPAPYAPPADPAPYSPPPADQPAPPAPPSDPGPSQPSSG